MLKKLEIPMLVNPTEDLANQITSGDLVPCPANDALHITILGEFICGGFADGSNKKGDYRRGDMISATRVIYITCDCSQCMLSKKVCKDI